MESPWRKLSCLALMILLPVNIFLIFIYAPVEKTMGIVQKVFYFHIASAWIGLLAFVLVFIASILYLRKREAALNRLALASAEIGTVFITCTLLTGPLWAYPIWNTWWTWDPRLTTTLVLWFMYLAYIALQSGGETENRQRFAAIYGIVAFINVPLVFFSARWWRSIHPLVITSEGMGLTAKMRVALFASLITFSLLYVYLLQLRYRSLSLKERVNELKSKLT
ncbi:MAG: cytochrome c biogenesis protein CcsA [Firmicutes bacterium]|nr:cytochrome c biogenesis protein CcsA [Bacillota bacterium]